MRHFFTPLLIVTALVGALEGGIAGTWRPATEAELKRLIPDRAPVEKERIETEFRTASGITAGGKFVAGVVLITAGYAAEGKYSNFFVTQVPLTIGKLSLRDGTYVFGWRRKGDDALEVSFYDSGSGKLLGVVEAGRTSRVGRIESFHIALPADKGQIEIGRFAMTYRISE